MVSRLYISPVFVCAGGVPGVRGVPKRQAIPSAVHFPQEEPQEKDHGENIMYCTHLCRTYTVDSPLGSKNRNALHGALSLRYPFNMSKQAIK